MINLDGNIDLDSGKFYSVGVHPWYMDSTRFSFDEVERMARLPQVVAVGECGLDKNVTAVTPLDRQADLLMRHIELSESICKPLLLHVVGAWDRLLALKERYRPLQPWIIHGFRGKPQLAASLIARGFYLSYGEKFNPDAVIVTPADRMLVESDESVLSADTIASRLPVTPDPDLAFRLLDIPRSFVQ